ncbi:GNAT family N-acetyltransferase [Staphylococcus xylosus]|uniref:GNAT family N-acetyltransferase n=1 Tax=Staphylococcus xylosus TaxID=1288 RepID=UPI001CDB4D42|nr:GNAT family N-acetyltransferase [Staphylococcus xylosus]MCE7785588.1 GNAT family N-acetyltransferase [Staphylococcus xylosus]MCM3519204.1 GNAT family N-acetyltransferase [Staphylococcus xylosus]
MVVDIDYEYELDIKDVDELIQIYHDNDWAGHDQEKVITIFNTATHVIIAKYQGKVIGFARAMSDGVFNAAIYDVMVDVAHQNQGIGQEIIRNILVYLGELSCVHLVATTGYEGFYRQLGFKNLKTGMAVYTNEKLKDEYTV